MVRFHTQVPTSLSCHVPALLPTWQLKCACILRMLSGRAKSRGRADEGRWHHAGRIGEAHDLRQASSSPNCCRAACPAHKH
eukprot:767174-Hanusia_phi.AAC.7